MKHDFFLLEPSMIAAKWSEFGHEEVRCQEAQIEMLHLDVMDGHFVKNFTMGPDMVLAIRKTVPDMALDVHLMIYSPEEYIETFIEAGANEITFHLEATEEIAHNLDYIRKCNCKAGLAIRPETSETLLLKYLDQVDKVLIMTVNPGFGGQKFMKEMLEKVKFIREKADQEGFKIDIQVDGGINLETCKQALDAGANLFVSGTTFFKEKDYTKIHHEFKKLWSPKK